MRNPLIPEKANILQITIFLVCLFISIPLVGQNPSPTYSNSTIGVIVEPQSTAINLDITNNLYIPEKVSKEILLELKTIIDSLENRINSRFEELYNRNLSNERSESKRQLQEVIIVHRQIADEAKKIIEREDMSLAQKQKAESLLINNEALTSSIPALVDFGEPKKWNNYTVFDRQVLRSKSQFIFKEDFHDGLACVKINNKYGYVNTRGRIAIPFKYSYAEKFIDGYAVAKGVGSDQFWRIIDTNGDEVYKFESENYLRVYAYKHKVGVAKNIDNKYALINLKGKVISEWYDHIRPFSMRSDSSIHFFLTYGTLGDVAKVTPFYSNEKWGLLHKDGFVYLEPSYDKIDIISEGFVAVAVQKEKYSYLWAYLDIDKKELICLPKYEKAEPFYKGTAIVAIRTSFNYQIDREYGVIDKNDWQFIPIKFKRISKLELSHGEYFMISGKRRFLGINWPLGQLVLIDFQGNCIEKNKSKCKYYNKMVELESINKSK